MRLLTVLLAVLLLASTAAAETVTGEQAQRARALYETATKHFRGGDLDQAAEEFKEAYDVSGNIDLLWNIAQTHRLAGHDREALFFYKQYRAAKSDLPPEQQQVLNRRIAELEQAIQAQHPEQQSAAATPPAPTSSPATTPLTVTAPAPTPRRPWYRRPAPWVVTLVGVGGAAAGAALLGIAAGDAAAAKTATTLPGQRSDNHAAGNLSTAGAVSLAAGGALVVVGCILWGVGR